MSKEGWLAPPRPRCSQRWAVALGLMTRCSCLAPLSSPAEFLASGPRICINLDGLMCGDHQLDFPCGFGSQLGLRGLPLAAQPGARWRVMACGGSGADVPHCARTQKRTGLDVFFSYPPFLLSFSFSAVTLTANSCSSLYLFILLRGGEGCKVADSVFPCRCSCLVPRKYLKDFASVFYSLPEYAYVMHSPMCMHTLMEYPLGHLGHINKLLGYYSGSLGGALYAMRFC